MDACKKVFGEEITFIRSSEGDDTEHELLGMIDEAYIAVDPGTGQPFIESTRPQVGIKITDLEFVPKQGDTVVMREVEYQVISCQTDGHAAYRLELHKAPE